MRVWYVSLHFIRLPEVLFDVRFAQSYYFACALAQLICFAAWSQQQTFSRFRLCALLIIAAQCFVSVSFTHWHSSVQVDVDLG